MEMTSLIEPLKAVPVLPVSTLSVTPRVFAGLEEGHVVLPNQDLPDDLSCFCRPPGRCAHDKVHLPSIYT